MGQPDRYGQLHQLNSGKRDATSHNDRLTQSLSAHIPLLFHPDPEKVMVLGLASGMTAGEVLLYPVKQLDVLEVSDQVLKAAEYFTPWNNRCLTNPNTRIILQDGRNHLELTNERYDIIISEPSNPWMAGLANLFTLEFFETVKGGLNRNGIFVQWIHSYDMDWSNFSMVGRTFAEVFSGGILVKTYPSDFLLVGFSGKMDLDLGVADKNSAYARESKNIRIRDPRVIFNLIVTDDLKGFFGPGPFHTDNWPRLEFAAPKNLDKTDVSIEERIKSDDRLSKEMKESLEMNNNIDSSLDALELMLADFSPPFKDVDLNKATPAQIERYQAILKDYCSEEYVTDYGIFPGTNLKTRCAQLQAGKIQEHLASSPEDSQAYYNLALALKVMGNTGEEIDALRKAISLDPSYYDAYMELGVALGTQGRFDEAITQLLEALRINPVSSETHNNLGNVLTDQGKTAEAIDHYTKALNIEPDNARAHNNLGGVLAERGETDEAIYHFTEALRIEPDNFIAHYNLGIALSTQGQIEEAVDHFLKAAEINPDDPEVHSMLGMTLWNLGRFSEAAVHFSEALKLNPDSAEHHDNLGIVLAQMGQLDEAIYHFNKALEIDSSFEAARDHLKIAQGEIEKGRTPPDLSTGR